MNQSNDIKTTNARFPPSRCRSSVTVSPFCRCKIPLFCKNYVRKFRSVAAVNSKKIRNSSGNGNGNGVRKRQRLTGTEWWKPGITTFRSLSAIISVYAHFHSGGAHHLSICLSFYLFLSPSHGWCQTGQGSPPCPAAPNRNSIISKFPPAPQYPSS